MKKQAFGLVGKTFPDYKGEPYPVTVGSIVEIDLDNCKGLNGLIHYPEDGFLLISFKGYQYYWKKSWFSDFWVT